MKAISATAVANMIDAHMKGDEKKFLTYALFIADAFDDAGDTRGARIVRSRIDGTYQNQPTVVLD